MATFDELQFLLLKRTLQAFGVPDTAGKTFQPATVPDSDQTLWGLFNIIPADEPVFVQSGSQFFPAYSAVIGSLVAGHSPFNPITVAKRKLADWGTKPSAWSIDEATMLQMLALAPSARFPFSSSGAPETPFWGLWAASPPVDGVAGVLAAAKLDMTLSFDHLLNFATTPSDWYLSSALANAYSNKHGAPWDSTSPITWTTTFGPGGTLVRMPASLIIADTLSITYTSETAFGPGVQAEILANAAAGVWPYYLSSGNATTHISFDSHGRLTASITTPAGQPVILAAAVLSASAYLGLG